MSCPSCIDMAGSVVEVLAAHGRSEDFGPSALIHKDVQSEGSKGASNVFNGLGNAWALQLPRVL